MIIPVAGQKRLVLVGATGLVGGYARSRPGATFSFLSGNGVDPTRRSRIAFARYNGEGENPILATGFPRVYIFRPAYIYPVEPRKEPNFSYRLMRAIYPVFRVRFPNQVIPPTTWPARW
jgi:hypothetical protein